MSAGWDEWMARKVYLGNEWRQNRIDRISTPSSPSMQSDSEYRSCIEHLNVRTVWMPRVVRGKFV